MLLVPTVFFWHLLLIVVDHKFTSWLHNEKIYTLECNNFIIWFVLKQFLLFFL